MIRPSLRDRLMVGHMPLKHGIGVLVPVPQLFFTSFIRAFGHRKSSLRGYSTLFNYPVKKTLRSLRRSDIIPLCITPTSSSEGWDFGNIDDEALDKNIQDIIGQLRFEKVSSFVKSFSYIL